MNETELEIAASRSNGGAVTGQSKTSRLTALEYGVPSGISSPHPKPKLKLFLPRFVIGGDAH